MVNDHFSRRDSQGVGDGIEGSECVGVRVNEQTERDAT